MKLTTALAVAGVVIGIFLIWGGEWLIWDWINSIVNWYIDWPRFCAEWKFYAPLFLFKWTCETWTGPYDLAKLWLDLGTFILAISSFILGYKYGEMAKTLIKACAKRLYRAWSRSKPS